MGNETQWPMGQTIPPNAGLDQKLRFKLCPSTVELTPEYHHVG